MTNDAGLNILSAFQLQWCLHISMSMTHVHVHATCRVHTCACVLVRVYKCQNSGLSSLQSVWYQNEKTNDAGTGPVPDQADEAAFFSVQRWTGIMNANAVVNLLDADAQLCH